MGACPEEVTCLSVGLISGRWWCSGEIGDSVVSWEECQINMTPDSNSVSY